MWSCYIDFFAAGILHDHHWHVYHHRLCWCGRMGFNQRVIWLPSMAMHAVWLCAMMVLWDDTHRSGFMVHTGR